MLVTLICENRIYGVRLPEKVRGRYWIEDTDRAATDPERRLVGIEAHEGLWRIDSGKKLRLFDRENGGSIQNIALEPGRLYAAQLFGSQSGYIFTEADTRDRCVFTKYTVKPGVTINIGKDPENQIEIDNFYISKVHAQLLLAGKDWQIRDNNSLNGVYVNERRVRQSARLYPGDMVYILGVKIVVGDSFIAINNPDGEVHLKPDTFNEYRPAPEREYETPDEIRTAIYYRSPLFRQEIEPLEMKIDQPPARQREDDTPLVLSIAPSLVMGVAAFSSGILAMNNTLQNGGKILSALPSMIMSVSMLMGMVLFPLILKRRDRAKKAEKELERREKYLRYLEKIREEIHKASVLQRNILLENYPPVSEMVQMTNFYDLYLWSRVIGRKDFLAIRLGSGNVSLRVRLSFPAERFSTDDDVLRDELIGFSKEKQIIEGVPVIHSLIEHRISGIVGEKRPINVLLNNILLQIAAMHSYDEVKLVFICDEQDLQEYEYVRWMPHSWDDSFRKRFIATDPEEVRELSAHFSRIISHMRDAKGYKAPHYVIISTSKELSDGCAFLSDILSDESLMRFSYLVVYDELKNLPKECTAVIHMNGTQGMLFRYNDSADRKVNFVPDELTGLWTSKVVSEIAEYRLDLQKGKYVLPGMITFLEMYRVGRLEHLNISARWRENNPVTSLRAPIGINSDGDMFYLDLHEAAHGPHGLVAGMTGSGKSEFIITYVLSMALNYSPDEVAFILIDYKGGGLVGAFENEDYRLPHLAGTITNLDGAAINRSLMSIQSELRRRQQIFNEARRISGEGTMDIYKYQKLYRAGYVKEPVPHLLLISDEFAELKTQQPEFMAQLISTARIGRSLGVHLILATQKPSGVVNDQIWANSRFKICLKVQDRADSMDMLKRPDAAELVETGRFYLQVGYNELFEMGQSAWCGAPYIPSDTIEEENDERVQMIDHLGNVVDEVRPARRAKSSGSPMKQVVEIVRYLARLGEEEQKQAAPLWLPELAPSVTADELAEKYVYQAGKELNPVIGELDDPFNQEQSILTVPLTEKGNVICYGTVGSGKEGFLTTLLYSLYAHHDSAALNTYILDFGAERLRLFEDAPQTGGVIVSDNDEKTANLFHYLKREILRRKKLMSESGSGTAAQESSAGNGFPEIVVVINNYTAFAEQYDVLNDALTSMTRDCTKYGVYFVLTCISSSGIRYKLQQNFPQVFVLQQNDKTDYISILGNTGGVYPSAVTGRGIIRDKNTVYEFQTASVTKDESRTSEVIRNFCRQLALSDAGRALPVPVLPKAVHLGHLSAVTPAFETLPIGLDENTIEPVTLNLKRQSTELVLAMDREDTFGFAQGLAGVLQAVKDLELYVVDPSKSIQTAAADTVHCVTETEDIEKAVADLFGITVKRHNAYKTLGEDFCSEVDTHPIAVIIVGLDMVKKLLSNDAADKLRLILEKTNGKFRLSFWVFDDCRASGSYSSESWCRGDGIWIGRGIRDQSRIRVNARDTSGKPADPTTGYLSQKGISRRLKLLVCENMDVEENDE